MHMKEIIVGEEPQNKFERYFAQAPKALEILEKEIAIRRRESAEYDAHLAYMAELNRDLADVEIEAASNERLTKPSDKVRERCDKERAAIKAKRAKADAARKPYADSYANMLEEFIAKLSPRAGSRPFRDLGYTAELPKGATLKDIMTEHVPDRLAQAKVTMMIARDAPATAELVEQQIRDSARSMVASISLGNVKKPGGEVKWPMKRIFAGLDFRDEVNAAGILFNIFRDEIEAKLIKRALEDYDEEGALTIGGRQAAIKEAEALILEAERYAAFWRRQCIEAGIDPGKPRVSNPLAILDVVEV